MSTRWIIFDAMGVIFEVADDTNDDFFADFEIRSFTELPLLMERVFK